MDGYPLAPDPTGPPSPTPARDATSAPDLFHAWDEILLGMPHLAANGLSESWLLKELGHRHWLLLARSTGRSRPAFHDDRGAAVYAAFRAISIRGAAFERTGENDVLRVSSTLGRVSRTQMASHHALALGDRPLGEVTMVSAFVRRKAGGGNHEISRYMVEGLPPVSARAPGQALAALGAAIRAGGVSEHMGFPLRAPDADAPASLQTPCPSLDFNGAGFLYFASFVAMVDRFEWARAPRDAGRAVLRDRDVLYHGNIDPGESIAIRASTWRTSSRAVAHCCVLQRGEGGDPIATVFTRKDSL